MRFVLAALFLLTGNAFGQSSLPPCPADTSAYWNNCFRTYTSPNGEKYVGEYRDDKPSGQGTWTLPDGGKYVGEWRDGKLHGQGTYTFPDGGKYVGEWRDDKANGQGTYTFPDGQKHVGEWRDGKANGQGTYTFPDGQKYVGEYRDDKRSGQGIRYAANGSILESGRWEDNKLVQPLSLDTAKFPFDPERAVNTSQADLERRKREESEARLSAVKSEPVKPPTLTQAASAPRNPHALIIGNAAYPGSSRLDNPVNDANAVSQKLRGMGFTVTVITDANRQRLVQALAQFRKSASEADLSLLYYSGHGVQISGTNYILPTDVDQSDPAQATIQGVSLNSVVESFMPGRTKLVFLDACRDNPLQRTGDRSVSRGLAPASAAQGTLISYATKDGQTASDGTGSKNSPFTQALLEHLSDPVDIAVVLRKVREKVMKATGGKQQPWEYGSLTGGELILSAIKR